MKEFDYPISNSFSIVDFCEISNGFDIVKLKKEVMAKIKETNSVKELCVVIDKIEQNIKKNYQGDLLRSKTAFAFSRLAINSAEEVLFISLRNILFIKADNTYSNIKLVDGKGHYVCKPISSLEKYLLNEKNFLRIHKSYIVNLDHVKKYYKGVPGSVLMCNGDIVPVARSKKEYFLELFNLL